MKNIANIVVCILSVSTVVLSTSTMMEVPRYMRESWLKASFPHISFCVCDSRVNPTLAYKSLMFTEISSDSCLKCFFKCVGIKLNLIEATTGEFIEKEILRQVDGATSEIFQKCSEQGRNKSDLCDKAFDAYMCLVHSVEEYVTPHPITTTATVAPTTQISTATKAY